MKQLMEMWKVQVDQIRYVREEYSSILVQGQFDHEVVRLNRTLNKNTSGFSMKSLDI